MSVETDSPHEATSIFVPLHPHQLQKVDPQLIYKEYNGCWKCDNCSKESGPFNYPYNCKTCSYDICSECSSGIMLKAHEHPLYYVNSTQLSETGAWECDVCSRTNYEFQQTHALHCSLCNFDLCLACANPKQYFVHCHPLATVKTSIVYPVTNGNWVCDFCGRTSRFNERYSRHCEDCHFDACSDCLKEYLVSSHLHPMVKADSNYVYSRFSGGWRCDNCGSVHSTPDDNKPWHCPQCEHDLCNGCMHQLNTNFYHSGDDPGPPPESRVFFSESVMRNPHLAINQQINEPLEPMRSKRAQTNTEEAPEAVEEGDECIICTERPKNATIIHGDTGHLCCCWPCAQVVKQRGDPCPICRMPIDMVIRQFKA